MMRRTFALSAGLLLLPACATTTLGHADGAPRDGTAVLARMHDRYSGKWPRTITFVQKTTQRKPDGTEQLSTWYEAQLGSRLRIDMGDPANGNGALYTADSLYVLRAGKVVRSIAEGNPFLPLIATVYLEPVNVTVRQLSPYKVDLTKLRTADWEGRPHYVIGALSASDTTSPQLWVEQDRLVVTRFMMPLFPAPDRRSQDVRLEQYERVGSGWIATRVRILDKGVAVQSEEYSDWRGDVPLAASLFQAEHWSDTPHWLRAAK